MDMRPTLQLDIFEDTRDVMLRNDLAQAVLAADARAAERVRSALQAEFPRDSALADAALIIGALNQATDAPLAGAAAAEAAVSALGQRLAPAATRLLGMAQAPAWLAARWRDLARRAEALPFSAEQAEHHAAALWLRAAAWPEAAAAVERIESWRQIPAPLAWMAQARWHLAGLDATWPLLAELAWRSPQRFEPLLRQLPDPALQRLLRRFHDDPDMDFDATDAADAAAWFPAWALTDEPRLAGPLDAAVPTLHGEPERAARLLLALLRLERQGRHAEVVAHRRQLQGLHAGVFRCYMRSR